jgi:hypothetical protein
MLGSILPFFKYGSYGAGFAFVVLTFWLLSREFQKSPKGHRLPVRKSAVAVIFLFAFVSLSFFFSAVFAESLVPDPFRNYVTLDMGHYGFDTTTNTIKFQMAVTNPETERYVPKILIGSYDVILGIREDSREPPERGTYQTAINHMKFSTIDTREWKPASEVELDMYQTKCVRFSIFGIAKSEPHTIGTTFKPEDFKTIRLFDTRSTGNHCG